MQESFLLPPLPRYIRPWVAGKEVIYSWNLHIFFKKGYSIKQSNACQYRAHWKELKTSQWLIQAYWELRRDQIGHCYVGELRN